MGNLLGRRLNGTLYVGINTKFYASSLLPFLLSKTLSNYHILIVMSHINKASNTKHYQMQLTLLPTVLLSITCLYCGLFTDALPSTDGRKHKFLRSGKLPIPTQDQDNSHVITVTVDDNTPLGPFQRQRFVERNVTVFDPAYNGKGQSKRPLVLAYHGVMSDSETMRQLTQLDREAKDRGWVAAYPQGEWTYFRKMTNWNGAGCCSQGQDDISFTKVMIEYMVEHFNVDENKVYVTGVSNGGFMVYRLLCEMGHRESGKPWIAAASVHSGLLGAWNADFSSCSISTETPLVHFHGLADPIVNTTGKAESKAEFGLPFPPVTKAEWKSVNASVDYVAEAMCGSSVITSTSKPTESTTCHQMCHGKVEYCMVEELQHMWSGCSNKTLNMYDPHHATNVDATKYFADSFERHRKNESDVIDQ